MRSAEEAAAIPLPSVLANALPLPHDRVADALRDSACWRAHFGDRPAYPTPQHLLLFVCSVEEEMIHAARAAAAAGFQRCGRGRCLPACRCANFVTVTMQFMSAAR